MGVILALFLAVDESSISIQWLIWCVGVSGYGCKCYILNQWACCTAVGLVCLAVDESAILSQWYPVDLCLAMNESVIHVFSQW